MAKTKKMMTPRTARTIDELCSLPRDNVQYKNFWMLVDQTEVHIHQQDNGEPAKASITLPKRIFDKMVDFYNGVTTTATGARG